MLDSPTLGDVIANNHWEQGSALPGPLAAQAVALRPACLSGVMGADDWLVIMSHPCDLVNPKPTNEPTVEILRLTPHPGRRPDSGLVLGQNPRRICVVGSTTAGSIVLHAWGHDRWFIPREHLTVAVPDPDRRLAVRVVGTLAIWLAKRYVRAAFPTRFDERWRGERQANLKEWVNLLARYSSMMSGVYLRLNTHDELHDLDSHYVVLVSVLYDREKAEQRPDWASRRACLQTEVERFWSRHAGIRCSEVLVQATDEATVDQVRSPWQKFEADWLSFADDTVDHAQIIPDEAGA